MALEDPFTVLINWDGISSPGTVYIALRGRRIIHVAQEWHREAYKTYGHSKIIN